MGKISVHEFITLDGVNETPSCEGDLYVSGSTTLVRAMLADGLVDELHLFVFPLALGSGERLFADGAEVRLTLAGSEASGQRRGPPVLRAGRLEPPPDAR